MNQPEADLEAVRDAVKDLCDERMEYLDGYNPYIKYVKEENDKILDLVTQILDRVRQAYSLTRDEVPGLSPDYAEGYADAMHQIQSILEG